MNKNNKRQILLINCSPRKNGQTSKLLKAVGKGACKAGMDVIEFLADEKNIRPCLGCETCVDGKPCVINDDMKKLQALLKESDAIVFGTPVYWHGMTAQAKTILDRMHACKSGDIKAKLGGIVVAADSSGVVSTMKDLTYAYAIMGVIVVDCIGNYAPFIEGGKAEEAAEAMGKKIAEIDKKYGENLPDVKIQHIVFGTHTK